MKTVMRLRIATWNVNSVRLRIEHLARFSVEQAPDVLCLQEIKCHEAAFPADALAEAYPDWWVSPAPILS